jgi:hypothetical protein
MSNAPASSTSVASTSSSASWNARSISALIAPMSAASPVAASAAGTSTARMRPPTSSLSRRQSAP